MKKIVAINAEIAIIRKKLELGATDWNKEEKEALAKAYFEITKVSTGRGRSLDTGCSSCIAGAVNIIKNYLAAIGESVVEKSALRAQRKAAAQVVSKDNSKKTADDDSEGKAGINDDEHLFAPTNKDWRKNHDSIAEAAKELEYEFKENEVSKAQRVAALEAHITEINK